jgi:hypothetical protein
MTFIRKEKAKERKGGKSLLFPSRAKINEKKHTRMFSMFF